MKRIVLKADEGMIYTNFNTWGTIIYLSNEEDKDGFFQVPFERFQEIFDEPADEENE